MLNKYGVLFIGILFLLALYFSLLYVSYLQNNGNLVYSLDDAYIHMAMAKNLAIHGVWGITKYEFTSCSSSVLWTSLIGLIYYIIGVNAITPLILNLIFGTLVLVSSFYILRKYELRPFHILLVLFALVIVTPLPPLMFTGLEHVMHIWVSLLFIYFAAEEFMGGELNKRNLFWLILSSALLPSIRYEGIFIVFIASVIFLVKKKWLTGIVIFISSFIPIFVFGIISINHGWSFFPNSLLLKGGFPDVITFYDFIAFSSILLNIFVPSKSIPLLIAGLILLSVLIAVFVKTRLKNIFSHKITYLFILFAANVALYFAYSKSGWSYRYQTFLVALGIIIFSVLFSKNILVNFRKYLFLNSVLTIIIIIPFFYFLTYGIDLVIKTPRSSTNIYEQQYQMGSFLNRFYQNRGVALNDIGACNYFADIKCVDLWGLSNSEISKKIRSKNYSSGDIRLVSLKNDVRIAILYDSWFKEGDSTIIPNEWIKVGEWKIFDNIIAGDSVISFYAVNGEAETELVKNLNLFSNSLPRTVLQRGKYLR